MEKIIRDENVTHMKLNNLFSEEQYQEGLWGPASVSLARGRQ